MRRARLRRAGAVLAVGLRRLLIETIRSDPLQSADWDDLVRKNRRDPRCETSRAPSPDALRLLPSVALIAFKPRMRELRLSK